MVIVTAYFAAGRRVSSREECRGVGGVGKLAITIMRLIDKIRQAEIIIILTILIIIMKSQHINHILISSIYYNNRIIYNRRL